ncbi:MAG: hypothetical protein WCO83_02430 [Alphaproteobacteria bacterium]
MKTQTMTEDAVAAAIRADKRRKALERNRHLASLSQPLRDPSFVSEIAIHKEAAAMKRAEAESLRIIGPKQHRKRIKQLEQDAAEHEAEAEAARLAEMEADRLYGEARDPIIMAIIRGEEVDAQDVKTAEFARDEHGARIIHRSGPNKGMAVLKYASGTRARKLTGLDHALAKDHLAGARPKPAPEALYEIGLRYGEAYEIAIGQTTNRPEGGGGGFGPKGPQLRVIEAADMLTIMRKDMTTRQLSVLNLVCGHQMRLREAATSLGYGFPAARNALKAGLALAMGNVARAREEGRTGAEMKRVRAGAKMMGI